MFPATACPGGVGEWRMYKKGVEGWMKHIDFIILDLLVLEIAYALAFYIRKGSFTIYRRPLYANAALVVLVTSLAVSLFTDNHKNILKRRKSREIASILQQVGSSVVAILVYLFFAQNSVFYSRLIVLYYALIAFGLMLVERFGWRAVIISLNKRKPSRRHMLLVTTSQRAEEVLPIIHKKSLGEIELVGMALADRDDLVGGELYGEKVVAKYDEVVSHIQKRWVDEVMVILPKDYPTPEKLLEELAIMGVTSHLAIDMENNRNTMQTVEKLCGFQVLTESIRIAKTRQIIIKRLLDILGGLIGVAFTAILTLILGPLIFFSDPGPIFFAQKRIGMNGRIFTIYKFRSMYKDAEKRKKELLDRNEVKGFMFKMEADPRIIGSGPDGTRHGIGWFIRKTSLDEFPQFLNVLLGSMSLCGTRPPTLDEWEQYDLHHRARMSMKPGLTGLWQVSGRSDIQDFEEVIKLDMEYINDWSISKDLGIILKTIKVIFTGGGAK